MASSALHTPTKVFSQTKDGGMKTQGQALPQNTEGAPTQTFTESWVNLDLGTFLVKSGA